MKKIKNLFSNTLTLILLLILGVVLALFLSSRVQNGQPVTQATQAKVTIAPATEVKVTSTPVVTPTATLAPATQPAEPPKDDTPEPTWTPVIVLPVGTPPPLPSPPPTPTATPINPNESVLISFDVPASLGAISPDGKKLAFNLLQVETKGNPYNQVWLLDLASKQTTKLVEVGTVGEGQAWSPDGKKLAYQISNYEEIEAKVVDIDGQNEQSLLKSKDLFGYYWINSEQIGLIQANSINEVNLTGRNVGKRPINLRTTPSGSKPKVAGSPQGVVIAIDNGALRIISLNGQEKIIQTDSGGQIFEFALAPNGNQIAYVTLQDTGTTLWVSDLTGQNQQKIFERVDENRGRISQPIWSPEGQSLVFVWGEYGTSPRLKLVWADVKSGNVMPLKVDDVDYGNSIFSLDGQFLYYSRTSDPDDTVWGKTNFYQLKVK